MKQEKKLKKKQNKWLIKNQLKIFKINVKKITIIKSIKDQKQKSNKIKI